ncbi:alpha-2-HS-glycoprotein 2 [Ictalurus punctatus]|uniref:Alpha-2-HS-glycoprotein 2 n=1 Tax=Ictalurus punctatus TaxID=7998 RepID=A0A2D0R902_ICTPU|nr:alpha-2-HS-glycoprotein 2 [Ictalurus punctatus]
MNLGVVVALLGLVACGSCKPVVHNFTLPLCDSPEAEAAAQVALDFINAQHTHGYKYTLNQIEDIKVINKVDGTHTYLLELEFLETKCHVHSPKPVPLCDVRAKIETAVEADCDVALSEAGGQFSVIAFKCKTELESFRHCGGCSFLQPLNDTDGTQLVQSSLRHFNKNHTLNTAFALLDIGRLSSQVVSGGPLLRAEYAIIETNCTSVDDDICVPLDRVVARHGFCHSEAHGLDLKVDCEIFQLDTTLPAPPAGPGGSPFTTQGFKHHKLTALHDPDATGLLSAESESAEKAAIVKRTVADPQPDGVLAAEPAVLLPRCPGKIRHF